MTKRGVPGITGGGLAVRCVPDGAPPPPPVQPTSSATHSDTTAGITLMTYRTARRTPEVPRGRRQTAHNGGVSVLLIKGDPPPVARLAPWC